ncbi:hypothetical protein [Rhizobium mongolense]|uniref:Uncharacterized protein n=1 Tax=Rhizobium mongolense TaxID=57676 RepID=A0A7W6RTB7_9HYPH|nr:hypothetical protein [Rhizobium mongolense]MBB4277515.1 hypothetical protein [Rhizobium mongolense]
MGRTILALEVGEQRPSIYLDLESDADRAFGPDGLDMLLELR